MPVALTEIPLRPVPQNPPRKRWTRAECEALEASGVLDYEPLELVEGELISKMGKNQPHVNSVTALAIWFGQVFGVAFVIQEAPIDVAPEDNPTNEPVPDAIVLKREYFHFPSAKPRPEDLRLVAEVADSSLTFDLTTKASLYARAGIAEYWILDVSGRRLLVHREPKSGGYGSIVVYSEHESVSPLSAPQARFPVADAFPKQPA
jgi:Uma2 family endonuclease